MGRFRIYFCIGVFLIGFGALEARLFHLQVKKNGYYVEKAEALSSRNTEYAVRRGEVTITDRNDNVIPVAVNKDFAMIYAVPKEIKNPPETAEALVPIIGWEKEELEAILKKNPSSLFRLLVEKASDEMIQKIKEAKIGGIYKGTEQARVYPFNSLASHALGFVGVNETYNLPRGLYGMEKEKEDALANGENIALTIDRNIQG